MLIILEGPDGAGKTSLAQEILGVITRRYPTDKVEIWKKGPPTGHPLMEYETPLLDYRPNAGHHLILDRWHVGEWVYPQVLGRDTLADVAVRRHIEFFLESRGAQVVYLTASEETLRDRLVRRGDDLIKPDHVQAIKQSYDLEMKLTQLPTVGSSRVDRNFVTAHVAVGRARVLEQRYADLARYRTFIGNARPNVLFLGDVRNRVEDVDPRTPAFMPYRDTSGHFLLKQNTSLFRGAAVANACDVDDVAQLWYDLARPQVIALGRNALRCAQDHLWAEHVIGIPHPQYVRRFHNQHGDAWMEAIRRGLTKKENMITWRP